MEGPILYLYVGPGATGKAYQLWPALEALPEGAIQEARTYVLELRDAPAPLGCQLYLDSQRLPRDILGEGSTVRWNWEIGFHAGQVEVRLEMGHGVSREFVLQTDPDRAKLTRSDFDQMVREALEDTFSLLSLSSHKWQLARGTGQDTPQLAQLEFLHSRLSELEEVVRQIQARPVRVLASQPAELPVHRVKVLSPTDLQRSLASRHVVKTDNPYLPQALQGYFPQRIRTAVKSAGLDIREHRAIKWALTQWASLLTLVADRLERRARAGQEEREFPDQQSRWSRRCRGMSSRIFRLLALPLFQEVSDIPTPVVSTPIFQRSPAYGRFLTLHRDFRLGIARLPGAFLNMPIARTFDLYELWAFLRLARAVPQLPSQEPLNLAPLFQDSAGDELAPTLGTVAVPLAPGMRLLFQREYRDYWVEEDHVGTFSRPMRPDITLELKRMGTVLLLVMDAKYRIEANLNDAISSAHVYRDSIVAHAPEQAKVVRAVQGAYLLSPHTVGALPDSWTQVAMPNRLFHAGYRQKFRIGAFSMRPGMPLDQIRELLSKLVAELEASDPVAAEESGHDLLNS